jgi:hypothetical protein
MFKNTSFAISRKQIHLFKNNYILSFAIIIGPKKQYFKIRFMLCIHWDTGRTDVCIPRILLRRHFKNKPYFYFYSKTNQMQNISNLFYFGTTLYMFRTVSPSIISNLRLYTQHQVSGICHTGSVAAC